MRPLLLINGYAATGSDWDPAFLAALERSFDVIHPDGRGTGSSGLDPEGLDIGRLAADMVDLLDDREVERLTVVGWSMGGFVAQELAATAPERVERLVLMSTDPGGADAVLADPAVTARLFDHAGAPREQAERLLALLFPAAVAEQLGDEVIETVAEARARLRPETLSAQERAIDAWHAEPAEERLAAISAPTLVMAGTQDIVIPSANATLLVAALADTRSRLFLGCGHAFMAQEAAGVAAVIREFATGADPTVE